MAACFVTVVILYYNFETNYKTEALRIKFVKNIPVLRVRNTGLAVRRHARAVAQKWIFYSKVGTFPVSHDGAQYILADLLGLLSEYCGL